MLLRAQGVRVAFFDVDGVLTDGGLYFSAEGETLKRFHTLDGHGIKLLARAGIVPCVISGRDSAPLRLRLRALGVTQARLGTEDKLPAASALLAELGLDAHLLQQPAQQRSDASLAIDVPAAPRKKTPPRSKN